MSSIESISTHSYEYEKLVVKAGRLLLDKGLVVRTWGNVSVRMDPTHCCITPTGASYEILTPEDVVLIDLETMQASGKKRPSSELSVHTKIYNFFPNANFILHTHQMWASLLSLLCNGKMGSVLLSSAFENFFGGRLASAEYAQAGTEILAQNLIDAIAFSIIPENSKFNLETLKKLRCIGKGAVLMAYHGLLVFAESMDEAFYLSECIEKNAKCIIETKLKALNIKCMGSFLQSARLALISLSDFDINKGKCLIAEKLLDFSLSIAKYFPDRNNFSFFFVDSNTSLLISCIFNLANCETTKVWDEITIDGRNMEGIGAYFDDVAQIAGSFFSIISMEKSSKEYNNDAIFAFQDSFLLLIREEGLLIFASSKDEAENIIQLFEKNMYAFLLSLTDSEIKPLNTDNARMLHKGYITSYSKKAYEM